MEPLVLLITTGGLARFTSAQGGDDIDLTIATVGVTDAAFTVAPTLTALPGEIKRLAAVSGTVVADGTVHMTVRDDTADAYGVRGFGLFLSDGTLFAVYGSADRVVEKSSQSTTLLALDIAFPAGRVDMIRFGDTNFLYPPATDTSKGVVQFATPDEVEAAARTDRAVTPSGLAGLIARVRELVDAVTAVPQLLEANGHIRIPFTPVIIQWGQFTANPNATTAAVFAKPFPSTCFAVIPAGGVAGSADSQDNPAVLLRGTITKTGFSVYSADDAANPCNFIAIGI